MRERGSEKKKIREDRREGKERAPNHNPLNFLLLSRALSYPLNSHPLNQQGGTQFKHLNPRPFPLPHQTLHYKKMGVKPTKD
jgi:hypothetical protein